MRQSEIEEIKVAIQIAQADTPNTWSAPAEPRPQVIPIIRCWACKAYLRKQLRMTADGCCHHCGDNLQALKAAAVDW